MKSRLPHKDVIRVTPLAQTKLTRIAEGEKALGIRLALKERGCSGKSYLLDVVTSESDLGSHDEVVDVTPSTRVYISPGALLHVIGTTMDYVEEDLHEGFVFDNPNAKSICGCGESFNI